MEQFEIGQDVRVARLKGYAWGEATLKVVGHVGKVVSVCPQSGDIEIEPSFDDGLGELSWFGVDELEAA